MDRRDKFMKWLRAQERERAGRERATVAQVERALGPEAVRRERDRLFRPEERKAVDEARARGAYLTDPNVWFLVERPADVRLRNDVADALAREVDADVRALEITREDERYVPPRESETYTQEEIEERAWIVRELAAEELKRLDERPVVRPDRAASRTRPAEVPELGARRRRVSYERKDG